MNASPAHGRASRQPRTGDPLAGMQPLQLAAAAQQRRGRCGAINGVPCAISYGIVPQKWIAVLYTQASENLVTAVNGSA